MRGLGIIRELLKNLVTKPMTVRFPHEKILISERYRGEHNYDIDKCVSCGLCARICPNRAIEMVEVEQSDGTQKSCPQIDLGKCCFCALCEDVCPTDALILTTEIPEAVFDINTLIKCPATNSEE